MTDKDSIGLQNFDIQALQTKVDALQPRVDRLATSQNLLEAVALRNGDTIKLTSDRYGDLGTCGDGSAGDLDCGNAGEHYYVMCQNPWPDTSVNSGQTQWKISCTGTREKNPSMC